MIEWNSDGVRLSNHNLTELFKTKLDMELAMPATAAEMRLDDDVLESRLAGSAELLACLCAVIVEHEPGEGWCDDMFAKAMLRLIDPDAYLELIGAKRGGGR